MTRTDITRDALAAAFPSLEEDSRTLDIDIALENALRYSDGEVEHARGYYLEEYGDPLEDATVAEVVALDLWCGDGPWWRRVGTPLRPVSRVSVLMFNIEGAGWPMDLRDEKRFAWKVALDEGDTTAEDIARECAAMVAGWGMDENAGLPDGPVPYDYVEVIVNYRSGSATVACADIDYTSTRTD
jgi:hypothetical protein